MMRGFLETCTLTNSKEELFRGLNVNVMFCGSKCVTSVTYEVLPYCTVRSRG